MISTWAWQMRSHGDSWHKQEIFLYSKVFRLTLAPSLLFHVNRAPSTDKVAEAWRWIGGATPLCMLVTVILVFHQNEIKTPNLYVCWQIIKLCILIYGGYHLCENSKPKLSGLHFGYLYLCWPLWLFHLLYVNSIGYEQNGRLKQMYILHYLICKYFSSSWNNSISKCQGVRGSTVEPVTKNKCVLYIVNLILI